MKELVISIIHYFFYSFQINNNQYYIELTQFSYKNRQFRKTTVFWLV